MAEKKGGAAVTASQFQRAVFVAVLSFIFFVAMMCFYYVRESMVYFLLATAFLVVYVFTMISLFRLRRR